MTEISKQTALRQNPNICSREFDGETVMMDEKLENYFGLDEIGTRIWQLLEQKRTIEQLCQQLVREYNVDFDQCHADIEPFLRQLIDDNMLIMG